MMGVSETVRRSTWYRHSAGRRAMSIETPYCSIVQTGDDGAHRDALRRRTLARIAHFGA